MSQSNRRPQTSTPLRGCVTSPGSSHPDEGIVDEGSTSHDASTAHDESSVREGRDRRSRAGRERTQLSNLNHRLADYIARVNRLESENQRLTETVRRCEETTTVKTTTINDSHQREFQRLQSVITEEAELRAAAQADAKASKENAVRLQTRNKTLEKDLNRVASRLSSLEQDNADLRCKYQSAAIESLQHQKDLEALKKELTETENRIKTMSAENAGLKRQNESWCQQMSSIQKEYNEHVEEIRKSSRNEVIEVHTRLKARADEDLRSQMEELRRHFEFKTREMKERHDDEMQRLRSQSVPKREHEHVNSRLAALTVENAALRTRLDENMRESEQKLEWSAEQLRQRDETIKVADESHMKLKKEYDELLNAFVDLQNELDIYRVLIEREERRLNYPAPTHSGHPNNNLSSTPASSSGQPGIPPSQPGASTSIPDPPSSRPNTSTERPRFPTNRASTSTSGPRDPASRPSASTSQPSPPTRKRRRLSTGFDCSEHHDSNEHETRAECSGPVMIKDHDVKGGKFIVLENLSEHDQSLGRWKVIQQAGNHKAGHRFPLDFTIKAKQTMTLWSANSCRTHSPPAHYVLKKIVFPWSGPGNVDLSTTLLDPDGNKIAERVSRLRSLSSGSTRTTRTFSHQGIPMDDNPEEDTLLDESSCTMI